MTPPPKSTLLTTRLLAGPALRFQPDGRLVSLVRDGYESAFAEIFRRYGAPLRSYAASIVTAQRADDVTQDAFTKAYLALRGSDKEIQLRPWLYRIVRNTALTNIRDEPQAAQSLEGAHATTIGPEELAEQREEIKRLMSGLRKLPAPQRAAIVMRELEGLSHEQIAASLGLSGGAVRQNIYRARRAIREGLGLVLPRPLLRLLLDEGFAQGASAASASGAAGIAVKTGIAALLAAGTVTTGAVLESDLSSPAEADATRAKAREAATAAGTGRLADASSLEPGAVTGGPGEDRGRGRDRGSDQGGSSRSENSGPGSTHSGSGSGSGDGISGSDDGISGSGSSGSGTSGSDSSGSESSGSGSSGSGSISSGSGTSGDPDSGGSGSALDPSGSDASDLIY